MEAVERAASRLSQSFDRRHVLQYGSPAGSGHYLDACASFLSQELHNQKVDARTLFATPGNSGGLALVTRTLTRPGDRVFMEDPSYFLAHQVFRDHFLDLVPLPQRSGNEAYGTLDIDNVAKVLWKEKYLSTATAGHPMPRLLYCVPTGNNPTGRDMPDDDRSRLIQLCAEHNVRIVSDDVYEVLQYGEEPSNRPKPMRWHANQLGVPSTVISLGSWSKIIGPGLRLGWIEAEDEALHDAFAKDGEVDSGSLTSPLVESLVTELITSGDCTEHLESLRGALGRRAKLLAGAINAEQQQQHCGCRVGGLFLVGRFERARCGRAA